METQLTNEQLLQLYYQDLKYSHENLADGTIKNHQKYLTVFFNTVEMPAFSVTKNTIEKFIYGLKRQDGQDMNIDVKQNYISSIKRFYNFLFDSDEPDIKRMRYYYDEYGSKIDIDNPVRRIKSVNTSATAKLLKNPRKEGLTFVEAKQLIKYMEKKLTKAKTWKNKYVAYRDYAIILLMLEIGLRYSDVSSIKKTDLDVNKKQLNIIIQKTKTKKTFILSDKLCSLIKEYLELRINMNNNLLFVSTNDNYLDNKTMNTMVKKHAANAGINRSVSCHILRHTCGALMYAETKDLALVKELLCHGTVSTTQRYVLSQDLTNDIATTTTNVVNSLIS